MKKLAILFIILGGYSFTSNAQVQATAASTGVVITPIGITKTADLNFGNIAVSPTVAGTVVLVPAGTRTATGGVTLPAAVGTVSAAAFTVTGDGSNTYAITFPNPTVTLTDPVSTKTMTLGSLTSNPSSTGALSSGSQNITVGGTLSVAAAQQAGTYTSAAGLVVQVNYN